MRLLDVKGNLRNKAVSKYIIDWDEPSRSKLQFRAKKFFEPYWSAHIVYEEFPVYGSRMRLDFFNATYKVAVEINGQQHSKYNPFFHNGSRNNFLTSIRRDSSKRKWAELNDFLFIEIEYDEVDSLTTEWFEEKYDLIL